MSHGDPPVGLLMEMADLDIGGTGMAAMTERVRRISKSRKQH